jgi:hypothetical protein
MGFKAPEQPRDPLYHQYFIALTNLSLPTPYGAALHGFCLYEFGERGERVRVVSSTIEARGSVAYYDPT